MPSRPRPRKRGFRVPDSLRWPVAFKGWAWRDSQGYILAVTFLAQPHKPTERLANVRGKWVRVKFVEVPRTTRTTRGGRA